MDFTKWNRVGLRTPTLGEIKIMADSSTIPHAVQRRVELFVYNLTILQTFGQIREGQFENLKKYLRKILRLKHLETYDQYTNLDCLYSKSIGLIINILTVRYYSHAVDDISALVAL